MAGLLGIAQTVEISTTTTTRTVLQLVAPANHKLKILRWAISFDGTSATGEPIQVRLLRQSTAGTMSALTPVKQGTDAETLLASAQHSATAEPTAGDVVDAMEVHPQSSYEAMLSPDTYIWIGGGGRLGIDVTAVAAVNCRAKLVFEE